MVQEVGDGQGHGSPQPSLKHNDGFQEREPLSHGHQWAAPPPGPRIVGTASQVHLRPVPRSPCPPGAGGLAGLLQGGPLCAASSGGQLPSSPPQKLCSPALTQGKPTSGRHPGRAPQPPQMLEVPPVSRRCFLSLPTPCSTCLWMGCPQGHLHHCGAFQKYLTST